MTNLAMAVFLVSFIPVVLFHFCR